MPRYAVFYLVLTLWLTTAVHAQEPLVPSPDYEPLRVVELQLDALRQNDTPYADAGIARAWAFAHPDNKQVTGPLERFAHMIKSAPYRILLDHRSHQIEPVARSDEQALFSVTIIGMDGRVVAYRWVVRKVLSGEYSGAWMTSAVSPPIGLGEET